MLCFPFRFRFFGLVVFVVCFGLRTFWCLSSVIVNICFMFPSVTLSLCFLFHALCFISSLFSHSAVLHFTLSYYLLTYVLSSIHISSQPFWTLSIHIPQTCTRYLRTSIASHSHIRLGSLNAGLRLGPGRLVPSHLVSLLLSGTRFGVVSW